MVPSTLRHATRPRRPRPLYVPMDDLLDAMDTQGDAPRFFLDTETGEVSLSLAPPEPSEDHPSAPDDARHAAIPQVPALTQAVDDPDVPAALQHRRDHLLSRALTWLATLGIEPQYELRRPAAPVGQARVGLFDMLLLGAPDGKTELINGRVRRHFVATSPEQAHKLFTRLSRGIAEHSGQPGRHPSLEDTNTFELDRCRLTLSGREVELSIAVSPAIWQSFR